jgi:hypothetical protein
MYQFGDNHTLEHKWSDNNEEKLAQLYFQLVRSGNLELIELQYRNLLKKKDSTIMPYLYKLIAQTRDITQGKGEYNLSFMLLGEWLLLGDKYIQEIYKALDLFIEIENEHPYGSWKDLKYFSHYLCKEKSYITQDHEIIDYCCEKIANQLCIDKDIDTPTLCAKWAPREKSKFGWMTPIISKKLVYKLGMDDLSKNECIRIYRQTCSNINKKLDTTQIKQCGQEWATIDFNKVTSITMRKQAQAFIYSQEKYENSDLNVDRKICSDNYKKYIESKVKNNKTIKGGRVSIYDFVKDALNIINIHDISEEVQTLKQVLNLQWNDHRKQNNNLGNFAVMVDVSCSMEIDKCTPLYNAIGLGIRISELSKKFKNEILTFSSNPSIVNLDHCDNFVDKVHKVSQIEWGGSTNLEAALELILEKLVIEDTPQEEVEDMVLCVLSDMQIDEATSVDTSTMFDLVKTKYKNKGYQLPTIVFWNLRQTSGFPSTTTENNVIMVSGYNSALLNAFSEKGLDAFKDITPFKMVKDILDDSRYDFMNLDHYEESEEENSYTDEVIKSNNYLFDISLGILSVIFLRYFLIFLIAVVA